MVREERPIVNEGRNAPVEENVPERGDQRGADSFLYFTELKHQTYIGKRCKIIMIRNKGICGGGPGEGIAQKLGDAGGSLAEKIRPAGCGGGGASISLGARET